MGGVKLSELIEDFKNEHSEIIAELKELEELGIHTKKGYDKLMCLIAYLLKHIRKEDEYLYPVLRKASEHNKKLQEILSLYVNGLGNMYVETLDFIVKYSKGAKDSNFQREYERLLEALIKRIEYEENILFIDYKMLKY